jgi:hypothetical protein
VQWEEPGERVVLIAEVQLTGGRRDHDGPVRGYAGAPCSRQGRLGRAATVGRDPCNTCIYESIIDESFLFVPDGGRSP